jgi:hypothetical protein
MSNFPTRELVEPSAARRPAPDREMSQHERSEPLALQQKPLYRSALPSERFLRERENQHAQIATLLSAQQTIGNRAVQRYLRSASPSQLSAASVERTSDIRVQRYDIAGSAESDVRDRHMDLSTLKAQLLQSHWPSPEVRRRYTRNFLIAYYRVNKGFELDSEELDVQMFNYEKLVVSQMSEEEADKELRSAPEWMKNALKTPWKTQAEQPHRKAGHEQWAEAEGKRKEQEKQKEAEAKKQREEQEQREFEKALEELEKQEQEEYLEQIKRPMRVDIRNYPIYTRRPSVAVALGLKLQSEGIRKINDLLPLPLIPDPIGGVIDILEGMFGVTITGFELKKWERVLKFVSGVLTVVPGANQLFAEGTAKAAKGMFSIAKLTGQKSKEVLRFLRGASRISSEQLQLLKEAEAVLKKGGRLSAKHLDAIDEAAHLLRTGEKSATRGGSDAAKRLEKEAAKQGTKEKEKVAGAAATEKPSHKPSKTGGDVDVVAIHTTSAGDVIKVTKDRRIWICTNPCDEFAKKYARLLEMNPDLEKELNTIRTLANPNDVKKAIAGLKATNPNFSTTARIGKAAAPGYFALDGSFTYTSVTKKGEKVTHTSNTLRLSPEDWEHITESHVQSTFNPAARGGKPVTTVFKGTPAAYLEILEEAVKNQAVIRELRRGQKKIRLITRAQEWTLEVDLPTGAIKTFYASGTTTTNKKLFVNR